MATVFVSHSALGDPDAAVVLKSVKQGLAARNHTVCVDMDVLKAGQEWASELYLRLAECHAAVILLSPKALRSTWVMREVNILLWRRSLWPRLHIVPALIGGIGMEDVEEAGFSELAPLEFARSSATDPEAAAMEVAQKILERFANLPASEDASPMSDWVKRIARSVEDVDRSALAEAARDLYVTDDEISQMLLPDGPSFLAHQFLDARRLRAGSSDGGPYHAVEKLADHMADDRLGRLTTLIAPTWVNSQSARRLLIPPGPERAVVILNAYDPVTAEHYINRASCCALHDYEFTTVVVRTGESFIEEFMIKCGDAVRKLLRLPRGYPLQKELARLQLKDPGDFHERWYLIVDPDEAKFGRLERVAEAVRQVRDRYPWLTIVLLTGADPPSPEDLAEWGLEDAIILADLGEEDELNGAKMAQDLRALRRKLGGAA
jgi:hypothetical protein